MLRRFISQAFALFLLFNVSACNTSRNSDGDDSDLLYYGFDSQEANITFETDLIYLSNANFKDDAEVLKDEKHADKIDEQIDLQIAHIFAALTTHKNYEFNPAVISNNYDAPEILKVVKDPAYKATKKGVTAYRVTYKFKDKIALHKDLLDGQKYKKDKTISFVLPLEVTEIYNKGLVLNSKNEYINECTDHHYNSEDDFWYFWNPKQRKCPLKDSDLVSVTGHLEILSSTRVTYPEYQKLYGDNGNGKTLKAVVVFGIDESFESGDLGRSSYTNFIRMLLAEGYVKTKDGDGNKHKIFTLPREKDFDLVLHVYLLDPEETDFDTVAIDALGLDGNASNAADIFLYDGHSGLGGHLAPGKFEDFIGKKLKMPKNKYQILIFQGCSTYAYYNQEYFNLKVSSQDPKGTKNLDILTAGIGLDFSVGAKQDFSMIENLIHGKKPTWQKIVRDLYKVDPELSALHQINGDEDNPTNKEDVK